MRVPKIGESVLFRPAPDEKCGLPTGELYAKATVTAVHYTDSAFSSVNLEIEVGEGKTDVRHSIRLLDRQPRQHEPRPFALYASGASDPQPAETVEVQTPQEAHEAYTGPEKEKVPGPEVEADSPVEDPGPAPAAESPAAPSVDPAGEDASGKSTPAETSPESKPAE